MQLEAVTCSCLNRRQTNFSVSVAEQKARWLHSGVSVCCFDKVGLLTQQRLVPTLFQYGVAKSARSSAKAVARGVAIRSCWHPVHGGMASATLDREEARAAIVFRHIASNKSEPESLLERRAWQSSGGWRSRPWPPVLAVGLLYASRSSGAAAKRSLSVRR